jgi:hypothetical protein
LPEDPNGTQWEKFEPQVDVSSEFREIAGDFGDPLEIVREAISNAFDAQATEIKILFEVRQIRGNTRLVIVFEDNGNGMTIEALKGPFWGLGQSTSREDPNKIGEKGHGTKIFLRSEHVYVKTQTQDEACESYCERPWESLGSNQMHRPSIRKMDRWKEGKGTLIEIQGYNDNERSLFTSPIIRDYIYWFTKFGSIELLADRHQSENIRIKLKCLDSIDYEELDFGHRFPLESANADQLFATSGANAADDFVKRYVYLNQRLEDMPEVSFDMIFSVEGDRVKRVYNPLLRDRVKKGKGTYKVSDRYGVWLCKDFIPIERVNEWITGFGTGSNSYTLLHGFINCQHLKLTANRGSVKNTSTKLLEAIRHEFANKLDEIDKDLSSNGIFTLFDWQNEQRTQAQEKGDFERRRKIITTKKKASYDGLDLLEPSNEAELFGLFMQIYSKSPESFNFEPLDYSTSRGIDMICRVKTANLVTDPEFMYVELKYLLKPELNHGFKYLGFILCWDFEKSIQFDNTTFAAISETDERFLKQSKNSAGQYLYFLDSLKQARKIEVIRLKQYLAERLGVEFK